MSLRLIKVFALTGIVGIFNSIIPQKIKEMNNKEILIIILFSTFVVCALLILYELFNPEKSIYLKIKNSINKVINRIKSLFSFNFAVQKIKYISKKPNMDIWVKAICITVALFLFLFFIARYLNQ